MKSLRAFVALLMFAITGWAHAGAFYNGVCYATNAEANDAFYGSHPVVDVPGSTSYRHTYFKNSATGQWESRKYSQTGTSGWVLLFTQSLLSGSYPACDPLEKFNDALQLSWLAALLLVVGFCAKIVRSQV